MYIKTNHNISPALVLDQFLAAMSINLGSEHLLVKLWRVQDVIGIGLAPGLFWEACLVYLRMWEKKVISCLNKELD